MGEEVVKLLVPMPFPPDVGGLERMRMQPHVEIEWLLALGGSGAFTANLVMWCPIKFHSCCGRIH